MIEWQIKAREFANCNCAYGCPCQFNALPTHGDCRAAVGMRLDEGHFDDVSVNGDGIPRPVAPRGKLATVWGGLRRASGV